MGEQAVDAVLGDRKLGIVVIVGMNRDAVGEGGETRRHFHAGADNGAAFVCRDAERFEIGAHDVAGFGGIAGEREPEAVEDGTLAQVHDRGGNGGGFGIDDKTGHVCRQGRRLVLIHCFNPIDGVNDAAPVIIALSVPVYITETGKNCIAAGAAMVLDPFPGVRQPRNSVSPSGGAWKTRSGARLRAASP